SRVGTRGRPPEPTDSAMACDEAVANLAATIQEQGATVTRGQLPTVSADHVQLVQLFQNLLGNAIKFRSAQAPRAHVEAQRQADEWRFTVQDNGIGIDPRHYDRLFVLFQRLH